VRLLRLLLGVTACHTFLIFDVLAFWDDLYDVPELMFLTLD
jgi:hypothetical protein